MSALVRVPVTEARRLCEEAFRRAGLPAADAVLATEQFVLSDLLGIHTHGLRRLSNYIGRIEIGGIKAQPKIAITSHMPAVAIVQGDGGLGIVIAARGLEEGIQRAKAHGISYIGCVNSNHFGANATYGWRAAQEGLICLSGTNGTPTMLAAGGKAGALIGNNPIGYAAPRRNGPAFLFDVAMSVASRGKLRRARELGETIPEGWGLDADGLPTTDPAVALESGVLPFGGHKGHGLAIAVEILSSILSGGGFGSDVRHQFKQPDASSNISHFFILIDPAATIGRDAFEARMDAYCAQIRALPAADPETPVRVPGEGAAARYEENMAEGLPMDETEYARLTGLADGSLKGEIPPA